LKFDFRKARKAQEILRKKLTFKPLRRVKLVAGCDLTFLNPYKTPTTGIGAFVVLSYPSLEVVEYVHEILEVKLPYVPGFLAFREISLLSKTFRKLKNKPDLVIVDGHGIAHPRRLGIAAHFGVVEKVPTIGCAKKPLYGVFKEPCEKRGCYEPIIDPRTEEILGYVLRTKDKVKPVYISPGNLVTLEDTLSFMNSLEGRYRIPEPTRLAHNYLQKVRKKLLNTVKET
jgi:deoxyribonuclease V